MLVKVRYEDGKLILLTPLPDLLDGQELWIDLETRPHHPLRDALIITLPADDADEADQEIAILPPDQWVEPPSIPIHQE